MTNHKLSLDDSWDFEFNPQYNTDAISRAEWRSVLVPSPWQAQFDRHRTGTL